MNVNFMWEQSCGGISRVVRVVVLWLNEWQLQVMRIPPGRVVLQSPREIVFAPRHGLLVTHHRLSSDEGN